MYEQYYKKKLIFYCVAGVIFPVLLGMNITVLKYNTSLGEIVDKIKVLGLKKNQIQRDTKEMIKRTEYVRSIVPGQLGRDSDREFILRGVDDLKGNYEWDKLMITDIQESMNEVSLPIELTFDFENYFELLKRLDSLEGEMFPFFRINSFSFRKDPSNTAICLLKGELVMPSTKRIIRK